MASGAMSSVGSMGREIAALAYAPDGFLYGAWSGPGRSALYQISPNNASTLSLGDTGVDSIVGISAVVPLPAALDLFGSGLLGLVGMAGKKAA